MNQRALILCLCFLVSAGVIARASRSEPVPIRKAFAEFPMQLGEWKGVQEPPMQKNILDILRVDDYLSRAYFMPDGSGVGLYVGYYQSQRQGDTMHSPLNCLPGAGWQPMSKSLIDIPVESGETSPAQTIRINRYQIEKGIDKQLVLYWYQAHGRVVASEYWGKIFLVKDAVQLNRTDGSLVRVMAPFSAGNAASEASAERLAVDFVKRLFPTLSAYLPS